MNAGPALDVLIEGTVNYATPLGDTQEQAVMLRGMYIRLRDGVEALVSGDDVCRLTVPTFVFQDATPLQCLFVVLEDRALVVWRTGVFRKAFHDISIPLSSILSVTRADGTSRAPDTRILAIRSAADVIPISLPMDKTDEAESLIRAALRP